MKSKGIFTLVTGLLSVSAFAGPTGLAMMPIADILKHREVFCGETLTGFERKITQHYSHSLGVTTGLYDRVEVGWDYDWMGNSLYNAKFLLLDEQALKGKGALSVGTMNYKDSKGDWYAVGRWDLKECRLHGGMLHNDESRLMVGADAPLWGGVGSLEFTGGNGARYAASYTRFIPQVKGLSLMFVVSKPVNADEGIQHQAVLGYGFRY